MAENNDSGDGVGYGRPPQATQFKKGQSGNPRGRPRKLRGQETIAARVLGEIQRLADQPRGARVRYTALELIAMMLKQLAAAGNHRAAALYTRAAARFGRQPTENNQVGYLIVPAPITKEEWIARYAPKDKPPNEIDDGE